MNKTPKTNGSCEVCGRPRPSGYNTCGASYCQEARHYWNKAKNARKSSPAYRDAMDRYIAALESALEVAYRRDRNEKAAAK
jgi:hypothetical protein